MRSNWLSLKAQEKFQTESCFCKTIACNYVTLLTKYLEENNVQTTKRWLLISKITLKASERRHLTTRS